jgi:hypothetical protein
MQYMQDGVSPGWSTLGVKCRVFKHYPVGGTGETMDDIVWRGGIVQRVSRLVLTRTCLRNTWHEALSCPVLIDCHVHMSGFRTDSSSYQYVVAKHT